MDRELLTAYHIFVIAAFLFFFGGILGWLIELFFRRFFDKANPARLWLNPGFLTGPCLPIYGFGALALFVLTFLETYILKVDSGGAAHYALMFVMMALVMTAIEFVAGIIFIKGMHIQLWDYNEEWGNLWGIICPKFTLFWGVLAALYYFLLFPPFLELVVWFILHPWFSFVVGTIFGLFIVDCAFSLKLGAMLRKKVREVDERRALNLKKLHASIRQDNFAKFFSLHNENFLTSKFEMLEEFMKRSPSSIAKEN